MFICVNQVKADEKNQFEINIDGNLKYYADTPWSSMRLPFGIENIKKLKFMNTNGEIVYKTHYNVVENALESMIPFKYVFKGEQRFMQMNILDKYNQNCGSICTKANGMLDSKFCFTFNNEIFWGYDVSKGKIRTISFYKDNIEIAQITKPINVINNLDCYYIHLINKHSYIVDIISFFVIYFDYMEYRHSNKFVVNNHQNDFEYTYSKNNKFYNPSWIKEQFGEEEYSRFTNLLKDKHNVIINESPKKLIVEGIVIVTIGILLTIAMILKK